MGSSVQEKHGAPGTGPVEGEKYDYGTGASLIQGEAEGAEPAQSRQETT